MLYFRPPVHEHAPVTREGYYCNCTQTYSVGLQVFDFLSLHQVERSLGKCDVNVADLWSAALQKQDLLEVLEEADEPSAATPKNAEKEEKEKKEAPQEAAKSPTLPPEEEEYWVQGLSDALGADAADSKKRPARSSTESSKKQAKPAEKEVKNQRDTLSQHKAKAKAEGKAKAEPKAKPEPKAKDDAAAKGKSGMGLAASFAKGSEVSSSASGPVPKKAKKA